MEIRPVGAELFLAHRQTERRTEMTKLRVPFRSFTNAPRVLPQPDPKVSPAATMNLQVQCCCNLPSAHDAQEA